MFGKIDIELEYYSPFFQYKDGPYAGHFTRCVGIIEVMAGRRHRHLQDGGIILFRIL